MAGIFKTSRIQKLPNLTGFLYYVDNFNYVFKRVRIENVQKLNVVHLHNKTFCKRSISVPTVSSRSRLGGDLARRRVPVANRDGTRGFFARVVVITVPFVLFFKALGGLILLL